MMNLKSFGHINYFIQNTEFNDSRSDEFFEVKDVLRGIANSPLSQLLTAASRKILQEKFNIAPVIPYTPVTLNVGQSFVVAVDENTKQAGLYLLEVEFDGAGELNGFDLQVRNSVIRVAKAVVNEINCYYDGIGYIDYKEWENCTVKLRFLNGEEVPDDIKIHGNSLDVSLAIAMFSQMLKIPAPNNVITSCEIINENGRLGPVNYTKEKLAAISCELPQITTTFLTTKDKDIDLSFPNVRFVENLSEVFSFCFTDYSKLDSNNLIPGRLYFNFKFDQESKVLSIDVEITPHYKILPQTLQYIHVDKGLGNYSSKISDYRFVRLNGIAPIYLYSYIVQQIKPVPHTLAIFDPKLNANVVIISSSKKHKVGDIVN